MNSNLTTDQLRTMGCCSEAYSWFIKQPTVDYCDVLSSLINDKHHDWAIWLLLRIVTQDTLLSVCKFVVDKFGDINISADEVQSIAAYAKTSSDWAKVCCGYYQKLLRGDTDSNYAEDLIRVACLSMDCNESGSGDLLVEDIIKYAVGLISA